MSESRPARITRRRLLRSMAAGTLLAAVTRDTMAPIGFAWAASSPAARVGQSGGTPSPQWESTLESIQSRVMGYQFVVAQNGQPSAAGSYGFARSPAETTNPSQLWTADTQANLASVSKAITAAAYMMYVQQQGTAFLDAPFWPTLAASGRFSITPGAGVSTVTPRQLLSMYSGMANDDNSVNPPNGETVDAYLSGYLQQTLVGTPGSTFLYTNTNYTILQVLYEVLLGGAPGSYIQSVKNNLLTPLGIDTMTEITDQHAAGKQALNYAGASDTKAGHVDGPIQFMAAAGWLGTPNGVLKFLVALRGNAVLPQQDTTTMTAGGLGIFPGQSPYGPYYFKSGTQNFFAAGTRNSIANGKTGIVQFPDGYDAVLFVNSNATPIATLAQAFGANPPPSMYPD